MQNNKQNFFDPKTIISIIAVGVVYFGWQTYLSKKYPNMGQKSAVVADTKATTTETSAAASPVNNPEIKTETAKSVATNEEKMLSFDSEKISFKISNKGMGLKEVVLNNYTDKENNKIKLALSDNAGLFEMRLASGLQTVDFQITEQTPGNYVGLTQLGDMTIKREFSYDEKLNSFINKVTISKPNEEVLKGVVFTMPEKAHASHQSTSFLFPSYEHQDFVIINNGGSSSTVNFSGAKENLNKDFTSTTLASVGSQYFATAILDKSDILPEMKVTSDVATHSALGLLTYKPAAGQSEISLSQIMYAGPKAMDQLKAIDADLTKIIDFGFFGMIARPLVSIMKAFHSLAGNWGVAIILLTLLVRLCVLPFNIMSMRSMKAMQKIQPKLQSLREKYKEDPMTLNRETMALMKENGANPLGGCLPMLIQIPVFFALYRVIGSSIELYQSPFFGWITDLSAHDKFYVLPVLMGISMFLQQKLTPTTMDPTQAKIMMFLPLVFSVFMLQLPSGLTLYMFVSALFGIVQQYLMLRDNNRAVKA